jgi:Cu+-exporting ATPase
MTRAAPAVTAPVEPADVPAPVMAAAPAPTRRRLPGRTAACAALTLAALVIVVVGPTTVRPWGTLLLSAVVVGWGGWPLHRAAWRALRRGSCADVLPAAGLLTLLAAGLCTAARSSGPLPLVAPAAATTFLLAGREAATRVRRRVDGALTAARREPSQVDEVVAQARHGAVVVEQVVDRATGGVAGIVAALAVATLGFWLGAGAGAAASLGAAAAVLLTAGPRAVGAAASTALLAATARAVAVRALPAGPRALERASRVDTVVLCRTGTVTCGVRELQAVHVAAGVDPDEALRLAGAVAAAAQEAGGPAGNHPVNTVVAQAARDRFGTLPGVAEFDGYPGLGVRGLVSELRAASDDEPRVIAHATLVGRATLLAEHGIGLAPELAEAVEAAEAAGTTAVAVSWDGVARAVLEVVDPDRPQSAEVVRRLHGLGIVPVLLAGDDAGVARGAAEALGVDPEQVLAPVATGDRAAAVAALRAQGRTVAVLGGPDDAAALAAADVALVRGSGSAVPSGHVRSDGPDPVVIALRDDDLLVAIDALRLARRAVRTVERTLIGAVAVHLVALPAAAAGVLPPLAAAVITAGAPAVAVLHTAATLRMRAVPRPATS